MKIKIEKQTCFYHEWREASTLCAKCGVPICEEDSVRVLIPKIEEGADRGTSFFHKTYCLICHMEYKETNKSQYTKRRLLFNLLLGLPFMIFGFAALYIGMRYIVEGTGTQYPLTYFLSNSVAIVFFFIFAIAFIVIPGYLFYYMELEARYGAYRKTRLLTSEDDLLIQIIEEKNLLHLLDD